MPDEVVDLRKGDRFIFADPVSGTFSASDVSVVNLSLTGVQIAHAEPLRIGTRARIMFHRGGVSIGVQASVVWSHLRRTETGMSYRSGLRIEAADPQFAVAVNTLIRNGALHRDEESLERKKQRMAEREEARKSQARMIPTSGG
jgi:hypothetical protein